MRVRFLGFRGTSVSGCGGCGKKRVSSGVSLVKEYATPNGLRKTFVRGRVVEVSDSDGSFLLNQKDEIGNPVFEVV